MPKITKRLVDQLTPAARREQFLWDSEVHGFGIRMKPSGIVSYLIQYRTPEGQTRRMVLGKVGTLTPNEARKSARAQLAAVAKGADPSADRHKARATMIVGELCDQYLEAATAGLVITRFGRPKAQSTVAIDQGRVSRHIKPCIGKLPVTKLARTDVQRMVDRIAEGNIPTVVKTKLRGKAVVRGGPSTAARVAELFGGIWSWAAKRGLVTGENPVRGVEKAARQTKDRVLKPVELAALGQILEGGQKALHPAATAAVRLIALTGMRRSEACGLRWTEIDYAGSCLRLQETKTGRSVRPMGSIAAELLRNLPRGGCDWVFPNRKGTGPADMKKRISDMFDAAGVPDARAQVLRRTFASFGADLGYGDSTVGDLIGHARRGVTARHYIVRPDAVLVKAADRVAERISAALAGKIAEAEVLAFPASQHSPETLVDAPQQAVA